MDVLLSYFNYVIIHIKNNVMKRYITIQFSQEHDNTLENYEDLSSLQTGTTTGIEVSSNEYANSKESIDIAVATFIKRLTDEFGYVQYVGSGNIQWGYYNSINKIDYFVKF